MATTTNYGWTTPDDTALVKDGASAIRTLGSSIDTSLNTALGTKKAGLVLLNTTTFSAVASQSISDVFNATYDNYFVVVNVLPSTSLSLQVRLRVSGSDYSTGDQWQSIIYNSWTSPTVTDSGTTKTGTTLITFNTDTSRHNHQFNLYQPFATQTTRATGSWNDDSDTGTFSSRANNTNSYTGLSFIASTGNITGKVSIYGYNL
jgi:hypothetical protein